MESDPHFYQIFQKCPGLFSDMVPIDISAGYTFTSRAYKRVARTYDGILEPKRKDAPTKIVEWQVEALDDVYPRIFQEMSGYHLENPDRKVEGVLIFPSERNDPKTYPWFQFSHCGMGFQVLYLDVVLRALGEQHPLYAVFQPFMVSSTEIVEAEASQWLGVIRKAPLTDGQKECLEEVFFSWLTQRLKTRGQKEIRAMFGFDTPVEETVFYKEVLSEGKEEANKKAIKFFEAQMKELLDMGAITKDDYQQRISTIRAQLSGNQGKA